MASAEGALIQRTRSCRSISTQTEESSLTRRDDDDLSNAGLPPTIKSSQDSIGGILSDWWARYRRQISISPVRTKAVTSLVSCIIGEFIGSVVKAKVHRTKVDVAPRRVGVFAAYGFFITGPVLHYWYTYLEKLCQKNGIESAAKIAFKLLMDRAVFGPPFVLLTVSFIQLLQTMDPKRTATLVRRSFAAVLLANSAFWLPGQAVNFGVVPVDLQLLYVNVMSVAWNTILSLKS